ncbi:GNAT family N-acetyltransferase [Lacticaseibacillus porcinae]|uniref:GNAT family N-acetyltransferase n=1 Tax=Lacticaseibacillus porcinae TaxID=1123687 RepID=UPI000F768630|nr:GNAT family N-acetyltransferase [Lacticaseibacillus porcinae]
MHLVGKHIVIRDFTLADAPAYFRYATDPRVAIPAGMQTLQNLSDAQAAVTRFMTQRSDFAITLNDQLIGNIGAYQPTPDPDDPESFTRELGYALDPAFWGQGLMAEALELLCDFLWLAGVTEIWAAVYPDNTRSINLLTAHRFVYQYQVPIPAGLRRDGQVVEAYYRRLPSA